MSDELTESEFRQAVIEELNNRGRLAVADMVEDYATGMASMGPCDVARHEGLDLTESNVETIADIDEVYFDDLPTDQQMHWVRRVLE